MPTARVITGFTGQIVPESVLEGLRTGLFSGVIWFKRNILSAQQVTQENGKIAAAFREGPLGLAGIVPIIGVDQEGGRVARLAPPLVTALAPMRMFGDRDDVAATESAAHLLGKELRALGFTMDFAPVLDVDSNRQNPVIGDRSFGNNSGVVIRHGRAFAMGLVAAGILPCGKHFPGHGDTAQDSHVELPFVRHPRERLDAIELAPFAALANELPAIMTAHVVYDALDPVNPATLSEKILRHLLRDELGFRGLIMSDDLEMNALAARMTPNEAAVAAISAGCDYVLVCSGEESGLRVASHLAKVDSIVRGRRRFD